jgi:drug/metabolite transporter (DMT)-like permease
MPYLYLIASVFFVASTSIFGGFYNRKNDDKKGASSLYNLLIIGAVFVCWLILFLMDGQIEWSVLPYAVLFGFFYAVCAIATIYALKTGPILLTSLMMQLSLIAVAIWGFMAGWQTPQWWTWVGLALVALALWLCLYSGKNGGGRFSLKWFVFVALMFFGNAGCSIVQKTQQMAYDGKYGNFLMFTAMIIGLATCAVLYWRDDKSESKEILKTSWWLPVVAGVANVLLNLAVMYMATSELSPSLIYPVLAVGSLIVTTVFSTVAFKEKMRWWQWIGVGLGMVATAILSV